MTAIGKFGVKVSHALSYFSLRISRAAVGALALGAVTALPVQAEPQKPVLYGTTGGDLAEIAKFVTDLAKKNGLEVKVVQFNDWITPNEALNAGDIDVNVFQNRHFLRAANEGKGYRLVSIGSAYLYTNSIHSKKYSKIEDIPNGSTLGIPNDPVNAGRALLLFQQAGLIKLQGGEETEDTVAAKITARDIAENPRNLKFIALDHHLLARSLDDLAAASVFDFEIEKAGGDPNKALFRNANPKYSGQIVVREDHKDDPRLKKFADIYRSPEVKEFIEKRFNKRVLATW